MALMTIFFFNCAYYYAGVKDPGVYYKFDAIDAALGLMFFPFVQLYFRTLMDETPLGWKEYGWFLPGVFLGISSVILYAWMGDAQATDYMRALLADYTSVGEFTAPVYKIHYVVNFIFYYTILFIQIVLAIRYHIANFKIYRKRLDNFLSNPDEKSLHNIQAITKGILVMLFIYLMGIAEMYFFYFRYPLFIYLFMILHAAALYYVNYHILQIKYTAESLADSLRKSDKEAEEQGFLTIEETDNESKSTPVIKKELREKIILQMNQLLNKDKIYLKSDLRLNDMASLIQTNRTYISMLISEEYQCNFSDLINRRRIDYAQQLILANPELSQSQVAEQSGFIHVSSFSRIFKQYAGMTFREFHKTL